MYNTNCWDFEDYLFEVTRAQAKREIEKHGLDFYDFVRDYGSKQYYIGSDVLDWLGY